MVYFVENFHVILMFIYPFWIMYNSESVISADGGSTENPGHWLIRNFYYLIYSPVWPVKQYAKKIVWRIFQWWCTFYLFKSYSIYVHDKVSAPQPATVLHVVSRHETDTVLGRSEFFYFIKCACKRTFCVCYDLSHRNDLLLHQHNLF